MKTFILTESEFLDAIGQYLYDKKLITDEDVENYDMAVYETPFGETMIELVPKRKN